MILKFESGGIPFVEYTPLNFNTASNYSSVSEESKTKRGSSDSKESGKLTEKDLLIAVKDLDALPSDSAQLYDLMVNFVRMLEMGFGDIDDSLIGTQFIRLQLEMKRAVYRKKELEDALNTVKENKAENEQAITPEGYIVGVNANKELSFFKIGLYMGEYVPITNFELRLLRALYYANNDRITQIIGNGIGLEKINSLVHSYINALGKDTISVQSNEILAGFELLQELANLGISIDEAIGNKVLTENQLKQAENALIYLKEALPRNALNLLEYRASQIKKEDGTSVSPDDILISMLSSKMSSRLVLSDQNKSGKSGSGSADKVGADDFTSDQYTNISRGKGQSSTGLFQLMDSDGFSVTVKAKAYPYLLDNNGNTIERTTLSKALQKGIGAGLYKGGEWAITFGDLILSADAKSNVLYESDGSGVRVLLPIKQQDGKIVPDLDVARENKDLISIISERGLNDPESQKKIKESGLFLDAMGNIDYSKFGVYVVVNAKSDSDTINNSEWVEFYDPNDREKQLFNKYMQEENPDYEFDDYNYLLGIIPNPMDWFGNYVKMVKGSVFIPVTDNLMATGTAMNKKYKESTQYELETQRLQLEFKRNYRLNKEQDANDILDGK